VRLVLDACVLFPTVVRGVLLDYAARGGFAPLWSDRILGEWARAAERRLGPEGAMAARAAAARMADRFPGALVTGWEWLSDPAGLPDPADAHVIAAARAAGADGIVTFNARDFPLRAMGAAALARLHPDAFLAAEFAPGGAVDAALDAAEAAAPEAMRGPAFRGYLKKAGLPRLAKARAR
jgi:hypothetical protein